MNVTPRGKRSSVAVIGLGYIGLPTAAVLASSGAEVVGVDINATHTRSATSGIVTGVCTPIHLGRSVMVHEIVVSDDQGRRCSTIRITNMIKDMPQD